MCGGDNLKKRLIMELQKEFLRRNPQYEHLLRYLREAIGKDRVEWSDITKLNMEKFGEYLSEKVSPNSARTYAAVFKAFLSRFNEEGIIPCKNPQIKIKSVPSQHIALTMDEIRLIDEYVPKNDTESDVKNIFMRGCLTGARYSDAIQMTMDNIRDGVLTYISKKTNTEVCQPVHAMLTKYLVNKPTKIRCAVVMNRTIKDICRKVGITEPVSLFVNGKMKSAPKYEFVTEHTSRRSYCTVLALNNVPTETIAKLAGHSNSNITSSRYICIDTKNLGDNAMKFFNQS